MKFSDFTVFIVDDDAAVRHSLKLMIEQESIKVKVFENADFFLKQYQSRCKGCIILDVNMPGKNGLELQEILSKREFSLPIIFLTGFGTIPQSVRAIKAGAIDFLTKPITRKKLLSNIQTAFVECAKLVETDKHTHKAKLRISKLTDREKEVMTCVIQGLSNKDIAAHFGISHRTVEIHRSNIMQKTGAINLLELTKIAQDSNPNDV